MCTFMSRLECLGGSQGNHMELIQRALASGALRGLKGKLDARQDFALVNTAGSNALSLSFTITFLSGIPGTASLCRRLLLQSWLFGFCSYVSMASMCTHHQRTSVLSAVWEVLWLSMVTGQGHTAVLGLTPSDVLRSPKSQGL